LHEIFAHTPYFASLAGLAVCLHMNICMRLDFLVSLSFLLAILFIGSVGAFLLYVPALTVFTVVTMLVGLGLMFALGMFAGRHKRRMTDFAPRHLSVIK
jgi:hypothetical protein